MANLRRWLPVSGALAVVFMVSTALIAPPPPVAGAPAEQVLAYFASYHVGLEIESVNLCIGMVLLMVFAATLHDWLGNTASLTALAAIAVVAACTLVEVAVFQSLVYRPNPDAARATLFNDLQDFAFQVTSFPALLFLASSAYAILTSRRLPRWTGQAAAVAAALQVVAWVPFFTPSGRFAAGGIPSEVAFAALVAWVLGCSGTMLVIGRRPAAT
ncbi:MAG TPA: hypothetical protein VHW94_07330 [Candidatus Dormibacteraeota bacterium]|nr:hypothetical protein [Candidatus Dormibacteraeota bacterium]